METSALFSLTLESEAIMIIRIISFVLFILCIQEIPAQEERILLFENYKKGTILFKNRSKTHTLLNFDASNDNIMFKQGNEEMILTNSNQIDTAYIGNRKFIPIRNLYLECIATKHGDVYVHWNLKNTYKGKRGAYGMTTQTKVESINTAQMNYGYYENQYVDVYQLSNRNEYYLFKGDKPIVIRNEKNVLKAFPEHQDKIKEYIKENDVEFSTTMKVVGLLEYCLGL